MNLKNLKIGSQLIVGFSVLLLFVLLLGAISYRQTNQLQQQTETMYDHPLQVRRAIDFLRSDILKMQRDQYALFSISEESEMTSFFNQIEISKGDAVEQLAVLQRQYLGPMSDVDAVKQALIKWNVMYDQTQMLKYRNSIEPDKRSSVVLDRQSQAEVILAALQVVDDFAARKSIELYEGSKKLNSSLNRQLIFLVSAILLLSLLVMYWVLLNIRKPLTELINASQRFHDGDYSARSSYDLKNEFGVLSDSFNRLGESIQVTLDLDEKAAILAGVMLSEDDAKKFFRATLTTLLANTNSQLGAVYLLSDNETTFEHFESIGMNENVRQSFSMSSSEGELGSALVSRRIVHLRDIPADTQFVFNTVNGSFIPREIITIPILAGNKVIAIISLASLNRYEKTSLELIDSVLDTLSARVEGILAYRKMKVFSERLEYQNRELEIQKSELASQAAELTEQNTELEMQKKQLGEANRLKTSFLSNMSHELRTPLNSVIALTGVLNRRLSKLIPEEEYSYLEVIERNGKHLLSLINDILDISRIEAGREEIEVVDFDLNSLVEEILSIVKPQADQKKIKLEQVVLEPVLEISNDSGKCRHILQNLIGNAVKFTEKGHVTVSASKDADKVIVEVSDTGIGIDKKHLSHIFDEFRQADGSTSRKYGGTGLGLAIAKKYANLLGGTISVTSTQEQGSSFTLVLPLIFDAGNRITETSMVPAYAESSHAVDTKTISKNSLKTILLVEDSYPAVIQMKDILEGNGYRLLIARNGEEALGIIAHTIPDAMMLDLMMPGIDGFEVLKTIREAELTAKVPVLVLTAKHITKDELKFLKRNNIHQLIQKGDVKREELLNAVAGMVATSVEPSVASTQKPVVGGKPVVLVVEDNPDNMITVKALLADKFIVKEAVDGPEGIAKTREHMPHLILMDIALSGMDGIEVFHRIRKDARLQHIPIIALTASAMSFERETILAHGFDAFIAKPINEKNFFQTINETLYG